MQKQLPKHNSWELIPSSTCTPRQHRQKTTSSRFSFMRQMGLPSKGPMEVGSVQMLLDLSLQKEAQTALHEQDEQCLDASKVPALPAHVLPVSCLVSALCWQGPKGIFLLCHHAQIRYAPLPPMGRCRWLSCCSCWDSSVCCTCP